MAMRRHAQVLVLDWFGWFGRFELFDLSRRFPGVLAVCLPVMAASSTMAQEVRQTPGEATGISPWQFNWQGDISFGTTIRTETPDPGLLGTLSTRRVGLPPGQLSGNAGGNNLNFRQGEPVSTVLKASLGLDVRHGPVGLVLRGRAWHDAELADGKRPYGNAANGFAQNVPLSDAGFTPAARFSGALLNEAYLFARLPFPSSGTAAAQGSLTLRLGRQVLDWGVAQMHAGGLEVINPVDHAARGRPGAMPHESKIAQGTLLANWQVNKANTVEGFIRYGFRPNVQAPCGTFFAMANYFPVGCNYVSVLGGSNVDDPTALRTGRYPKRVNDALAPDGGQYGLSFKHVAPSIQTEWRFFAANHHASAASVRVINPDIAGGYGSLANLSRLTDPGGLKYAVLYVPDVKLFGASFMTQVNPHARLWGELSYRPNQPVNINASDLIAAFVTRAPNSILQRAFGTNALPPGAQFDGYQRFRTTNLVLGGSTALPLRLAQGLWRISGEVAYSQVHGLPDPALLRFGRSDDYGAAAVPGVACVDPSVAQKACALDGFITPAAWGFRLLLDARFKEGLGGAVLTPSFMLAHDVHGYSWDGNFLQGRTVLRPSLRLDWDKLRFQIQYTRLSGGRYHTQTDRDSLSLSVARAL